MSEQSPNGTVETNKGMTAAQIISLILMFGPSAVELIGRLVDLWDKPLSVGEVNAILVSVPKKTYDEYIAEAKAKLNN